MEFERIPTFEETLARLVDESKRDPFPESDCIIEIGHNIERGQDNKFYPARLAIPIREDGTWPDGAKRYARTGRRTALSMKDLYDSDLAIAAGGVVEVAAFAELYDNLRISGHTPKLVVHTGGRPGYLNEAANDQPDMTEAKPMVELFHRRVDLSPETKEFVLEGGKNTKDDIIDSLTKAVELGCKSATILALEMRLPRCLVFVQEVLKDKPDLAAIEVKLRSVEMIIAEISKSRGRQLQWESVLNEFQASKPYLRTLNDEANGFNMALKGRYSGTGKQ